jgi:hypothetical protein
MSEDATIDPQDDDSGDDSPTTRELRQQLRAANKRAAELAKEADEGRDARRQLAFSKASIPDTGPGRLFREHYAGDLDPEVIKTAAAEYGIVDNAPVAGVSDIEAQSAAAQGASGNVIQGSDEELLAEIEKAAATAPRGFTSQAVADVMRRYRGNVQF